MRPAVRTAVPEDEREIYRLLMLGHAELGIYEAAPLKVAWFVRRFLGYVSPHDTGPRGVFGVIGPPGGVLEGLCMLGIGTFWYTETRYLEEFIIYVDPTVRVGKRALGQHRALIEWMKAQADKTGLQVQTGIMSNVRTEAKCKLYARSLPKIGEYFMYPAKFHSDEVTGPGRAGITWGSSVAA